MCPKQRRNNPICDCRSALLTLWRDGTGRGGGLRGRQEGQRALRMVSDKEEVGWEQGGCLLLSEWSNREMKQIVNAREVTSINN